MIKILSADFFGDYCISCDFSDGTTGIYDVRPLLFSSDTPLTVPLRNSSVFAKFFLRSGALCWNNGLELDPLSIHLELEQAGTLNHIKKVA